MKRLFAQGPLDRNVRAQFEHWYSDGGKSPKAIERKPGANGAYIYSGAATAWDVWQAAVSVERETCAELCEEVGFAEHGPGREDSEAYDCADEIRMRSNAKSQATDAALSRQVACTDGLGVAVPPAPTFGKD